MRSLVLMSLVASQLAMAASTAGAMPEPQIPFAPRQYVCYRTGDAMVIDGEMGEPAWQDAPWTDHFVDIQGDLRPLPYLDTRVKMLWDDTYFYFLAELEDPHVRATFTERDSYIFWEDSDIEIFIDPDGDTHNYFELEQNAFGTYWDLSLDKPYRDGGRARDAYTFDGLQTRVHVDGTINDPSDTDVAWTSEIAIPWSSLVAPGHASTAPAAGDQWRVNFSRVHWQLQIDTEANTYTRVGGSGDEENWVWSPQGLINMHYPEMWGVVQFSAQSAGAGAEAFEWDSVQDAKWALRRVFYAEKTYRDRNRSYTDSVEDLGLAALSLDGYTWPPQIAAYSRAFTASVEDTQQTHAVHIQQDGRVWVEPLEPRLTNVRESTWGQVKEAPATRH
jgi:hypothetical protein